MTDIDFDELDKAVSSVMEQKQPMADKKEESSSAADQPVPQEQPAPDTTPPTVTEAAVVIPEPQAATEMTPKELPGSNEPTGAVNTPEMPQPVKRSGRFMDVVHPSSDMATARSDMPREGVAIAPLEPITPVEPTSQPLPEPLSPFLPDANEKVEKRPLGPVATTAPSTEEAPEQPPAMASTDAMPESAEATAENPEAQGDMGAQIQTPLPEELKDDVVALESTESVTIPAMASSMEQTLAVPTQEGPAEEHAPAFTTEGHAPLMHPKKKRSGVKIVLIILGLVAAGIIGGLAFYFTSAS